MSQNYSIWKSFLIVLRPHERWKGKLYKVELRHTATSGLVCTVAATSRLPLFCRCVCRTDSNQFEFVRQIAATKVCHSDIAFQMSHEAICCSNMPRRRVGTICRIVSRPLVICAAQRNISGVFRYVMRQKATLAEHFLAFPYFGEIP